MKTSHHNVSATTSSPLSRKDTGVRCRTIEYSRHTLVALGSSSVDTAMEIWSSCSWGVTSSSLLSPCSSFSICWRSTRPSGMGAHLTLTCSRLGVPASRFHLCVGQRNIKRDREQWTDVWRGWETWESVTDDRCIWAVGDDSGEVYSIDSRSEQTGHQSGSSKPNRLKPWGVFYGVGGVLYTWLTLKTSTFWQCKHIC